MTKNRRGHKGNDRQNKRAKGKGNDRLEQALIRLTHEVAQLTEGQQGLQETVAHLTEGQRQLQETVARLAEEQQRLTEGQRQLQETVAHLAEEQRRLTEGQRQLQQVVTHLTEGQRRLQETVVVLVEGQNRLQEAVAQLAEENRKMTVVLKEVNRKVGRIDEQLGLTVESVAQVVPPPYLEKRQGIHLEGKPGYELKPIFLRLNGEWEQINLYGEGTRDGEKISVVCECKARIHARDVHAFAKKLARVELYLRKPFVAVLFGFFIHPSAEEPASANRILLVGALQR